MKKRISIALNAICAYLILSQLGVWNSIVLFILVGALPGTTRSIPPLVMFVLFIMAVIGAITGVMYLIDRTTTPTKKLPAKRYNRV